MAGHNKWSKIKRKKAVTDSRRSKAWTMCLRAVMMAARSGGAGPDDIQFDDDDEAPTFTVLTPVPAFLGVKAAIERAKLAITEARIEPIPTTLSPVSGDAAKQTIDLVEALEESDDVQRVHTNA